MTLRFLAVGLVLSVLAAACSDPVELDGRDLVGDFNQDGRVVIGVATDGPRDDGAYYQALVERIESISAVNGFDEPIVVDLIDPADADSELEALAQQGVDIIAVGSSAIAEGLPALALEYDEIFWYCNCGSGSGATAGVLKSEDRGAELWISGGYAAGILMLESEASSAVFLGCCDLNFEAESFNAFVYGLTLVDSSYTATYVPTGNFPFDFNNTAGATEAYINAVAEGADVVVPFLGGAHEPIVRLANDDDVIVMTAGSSRGCERDDLDYAFEVKFDAGDYVTPIFADILNGVASEGGVREFHVGIDPEVGAEFCDGATSEQIDMLDALNVRIGAGEFAEQITAIVSEAYGF
ncbi:MAG: hypothetical protein V3U50_03655 [Acidimicrobiia bacterium]